MKLNTHYFWSRFSASIANYFKIQREYLTGWFCMIFAYIDLIDSINLGPKSHVRGIQLKTLCLREFCLPCEIDSIFLWGQIKTNQETESHWSWYDIVKIVKGVLGFFMYDIKKVIFDWTDLGCHLILDSAFVFMGIIGKRGCNE